MSSPLNHKIHCCDFSTYSDRSPKGSGYLRRPIGSTKRLRVETEGVRGSRRKKGSGVLLECTYGVCNVDW